MRKKEETKFSKLDKLGTSLNGNRAITLVSLVVTVIILIILAGVSINLVLGENGILEMAKRAKENMELTQLEEQERLNELYKDLNYEEGEGSGGEISYDIIAKLNEFKKKIADYIEEAGGIKPEYTANIETFGERIKGIVANVTKETNAEEPQILTGYKAYSKGKIRIGSMANQGAKTTTLNAGTSYTIPKGYHNGQGVITAKDLASQTAATATADDILEGKTAWVNGIKVTGTSNSTNKPVLLWTNTNIQAQETFTISCNWNKYDKIIMLFGHHYQLYSEKYRKIICIDKLGSNAVGGSIVTQTTASNFASRTITFQDGIIKLYATVPNNFYSYNIPLKIWGLNTSTDFYSYP